ncbi:hypothetical protein [Streptomyces mirabilis]|uniref:hypothetical protein n=1 Tax=Streptomyces mirabilis TaxID=68239 RepID=UPI00340BA233
MQDLGGEIAVEQLTPAYLESAYEVQRPDGTRIGFVLAEYEVLVTKDGTPEWSLITKRGVRIRVDDPSTTKLRWPVPAPTARHEAPAADVGAAGSAATDWYRPAPGTYG